MQIRHPIVGLPPFLESARFRTPSFWSQNAEPRGGRRRARGVIEGDHCRGLKFPSLPRTSAALEPILNPGSKGSRRCNLRPASGCPVPASPWP